MLNEITWFTLCACIQTIPGAAERLKLFKADLLMPGSFDEAFAACDYVVHTASPFKILVTKGRENQELIQPAIKGTKNVLGEHEY